MPEFVDEHAAVDLSDVDLLHLAGEQGPDGRFEVQRDADIPGEMIERAYRQNAKRRIAPGQRAGDRIDRSIASARHHEPAILPQSPSGRKREVGAPGDDDARLYAEFRGNADEMLAGRLQAA
jgi:hypothetical protein